MTNPLTDLLYPDPSTTTTTTTPPPKETNTYTTRLTTLSLSSLTTTEPDALHHDAQSLLRSLQALTKRSYKAITTSTASLSSLSTSLPSVAASVADLRNELPDAEKRATAFAEKYARAAENPTVERRRRVMRLEERIEKVGDVLELPSLLSNVIAASSTSSTTGPSGGAGKEASSSAANYAQALDLHAQIKRLARLYPSSNIIHSINTQADSSMQQMTTRILTSLRSPSLKLAGAMRLIGLLRRLCPDLDDTTTSTFTGTSEGALGLLFLTSRLSNLRATLSALEPLQELADAETHARRKGERKGGDWAAGQQSERYLKRYIEVFREQCFAMVSMYRSIFPTSLAAPPADDLQGAGDDKRVSDGKTSAEEEGGAVLSSLKSPPLRQDTKAVGGEEPLPPAIATFCWELIDTLVTTLKGYLPNVRDQTARESLLTGVLYCAGSLGRLGGDFGMVLALLQEEMEEEGTRLEGREGEWVEVMKRQRVQASRLETLGAGAAKTREVSTAA